MHRKYPHTCDINNCPCGNKEFVNSNAYYNAHGRKMSSADSHSSKKPKLEAQSATIVKKNNTRELNLPSLSITALNVARTVLKSHQHVEKVVDGSIFQHDEDLHHYLKTVQTDNVGQSLEQIFEANQENGKMDLDHFMACFDLSSKKKAIAERLFKLFDKDGNDSIDVHEFLLVFSTNNAQIKQGIYTTVTNALSQRSVTHETLTNLSTFFTSKQNAYLDLHLEQSALLTAKDEAEWKTSTVESIIASYKNMSAEELVVASQFHEWGLEYINNLVQQKIGFTNEDRFLKEYFDEQKLH